MKKSTHNDPRRDSVQRRHFGNRQSLTARLDLAVDATWRLDTEQGIGTGSLPVLFSYTTIGYLGPLRQSNAPAVGNLLLAKQCQPAVGSLWFFLRCAATHVELQLLVRNTMRRSNQRPERTSAN